MEMQRWPFLSCPQTQFMRNLLGMREAFLGIASVFERALLNSASSILNANAQTLPIYM